MTFYPFTLEFGDLWSLEEKGNREDQEFWFGYGLSVCLSAPCTGNLVASVAMLRASGSLKRQRMVEGTYAMVALPLQELMLVSQGVSSHESRLLTSKAVSLCVLYKAASLSTSPLSHIEAEQMGPTNLGLLSFQKL